MHRIILLSFIFFVATATAQNIVPGTFVGYAPRGAFVNNMHPEDSLSKKKWSFNKYSSISTSFNFFNGGNATIIAAPIGLQLNRRLNNNWYAFANVTVAPGYVSFNRSFNTVDFNKTNHMGYKSNSLNLYSSASLGLQYVNDAKTFSISGSISVEKSSYPLVPFYPPTALKPNTVIPVYR